MGFFDNLFAPKTTTATVESVTAGIDEVQAQIDELRAAVASLKPVSAVVQAGGARKKQNRRTIKNRRRK